MIQADRKGETLSWFQYKHKISRFKRIEVILVDNIKERERGHLSHGTKGLNILVIDKMLFCLSLSMSEQIYDEWFSRSNNPKLNYFLCLAGFQGLIIKID